ncbi:hypothetical protein MIND_00126500 [Mycena indigotica]|uniref:F-box domain-containing protein n=1 Tax=Mycena indigotica TaxID=2126181 RepID=A0A8H6TF26_9AGAR|nr:uncharacterized protein MIND_00126500 [Mycena indigotica]KAF7316084.1 hypothetical protein MIND_00126500 [Mycena indigotica]
MEELPQELLDAILDQIHDRNTLRACCLSASCLRLRSQQRLFRSMRIPRARRPHRQHKRQQRRIIASIFAESPHLAQYVRDLTVELAVEEAESAELNVILSAVRNLRGLAVNGQYTDWSNIAAGTTGRIVECLKLPSLQQVRWQLLICVPVAVVQLLLAVPIVSLDIVHMLCDTDIQPHMTPLHLRDLSFMRDGGTISRFLLQYQHYLVHLKRMEVRTEEYDEQATLLQACSPTLETLAIVISGSTSPSIHIAPLPCVRSVEITAFSFGKAQLPRTLLDIVESLAAFPTLSAISFVFKLRLLPGSVNDQVATWDFPPLPAFSIENFAKDDIFDALRLVRCRLVIYLPQETRTRNVSLDALLSGFRAAVKQTRPRYCSS